MSYIHAGLTTWSAEDYAAGFRARFDNLAASNDQSHSWQCGWEDAHLELSLSERHRQRPACGEADDCEESWVLLFDAGGDARVNGIAFDARRTEPWKEGWIDADINLGAAASRT
jgi:hypothetical protein